MAVTKVIKIDDKGKIDLSHAATIEGYVEKEFSRPKKDFKKDPKDSKKKFVKKSLKEEKAEDEEVVVITTGSQE